MIDVTTLKTLHRREITSGFCEAVKQGVISDQKLFQQTADFLRNYPTERFNTFFETAEFFVSLSKLIAAQVAFKAKIVANDEQENPEKNDSTSRKILNFGHTIAHALEKVTQYKYLKHGEAVGIGMLVAADISKKLGYFDKNSLNSLIDVVASAGELPDCSDLDSDGIIQALEFDKKNIGNSLQWILLEDIGKPFILPNFKIPDGLIGDSIEMLLKR